MNQELGYLVQSFKVDFQTLPDGKKIAVLAFKASGKFDDPNGPVVAEFPMSYQLFNDLGIVVEKLREKHGKLPADPNGYIEV